MTSLKPICLKILAFIAIALCFSCTKGHEARYTTSGGRILKDGAPVYYVGTNFWYGPLLSDERLAAELDSLKSLGMTNLRVLVGSDGPETVDNRVKPAFQTEPGVYNPEVLAGLDRFMAEIEKRDMSAVLYLNNSWEWSGGYGTYLEWAGAGNCPNTAIDGYWPFMNFCSNFITNDKAQELFFNHVRFVVDRYKNSSAIFSWQIANEPRCFSSDPEVQKAFVDFIWNTAALIKSIDPEHMVSTGSEGAFGCEGSYELYEKIATCPDVDYLNIHIWPYNWNWTKEDDLMGCLPAAIENTDTYIDKHLELARKLSKPVVIEEFGYPRDGFQFSKNTTTEARDAYYQHVFDRVCKSAEEGDVLAGANFWGWGGLAAQAEDHIYWQRGDDYCGDPAQEQQGLNSVYASDASTIAIIREANRRLSGTVRASVPVEQGWLFEAGKKASLEAEVSCSEGIDVTFTTVLIRDLSLMSELKDTVKVSSTRVQDNGKQSTSVSLDLGTLEPGFYQVNINYEHANGTKGSIKPFNIGCSPEQIVSPSSAKEDFDAFWEQNLSELAGIPMEAELTLIPERSDSCRNVYRVEYKSLGGVKAGGILAEPVAEGSYPAYIEYMGYGADVYLYNGSDRPDAIQFLVSVRDQGIFRDEQKQWIDRGLDSKENFYYRGAFCDAVRAVDFVASRQKVDRNRIFGLGESQGGAFTWIAASLDHRFRAIAPAVPFLSDYEDYARIVSWPVHEVFQTADRENIDRAALMDMLSYFDVKNFTSRISCPVKMGFGLQDPVCPPHTNFAGYNNVSTEKSWNCYPLCGHGIWQVKEWAETRDQWFGQFK